MSPSKKMISVLNDYCSDHLPNKDEEIDMDYHWQIEDQRLPAERNQRQFKQPNWDGFIFTFYFFSFLQMIDGFLYLLHKVITESITKRSTKQFAQMISTDF
jgi:hypothetical protein